MSMRGILLIVIGSLTLARPAYSQVPANSQDLPKTPSEVARLLVDQGQVIQMPVKGKVKHSIKKGAPTFAMPGGPSSVVLLRLPDYQAPYVTTITSSRRGIGRTTEIFIPSGLYFDAEFQQLGEFGEDRLVGRTERVAAAFAFGETNRNTRYVLLYTRGELVGQRVDMRASIVEGVAVPGKVGTVLGSGFGLGRLVRSLEGNIELETKPDTKPK